MTSADAFALVWKLEEERINVMYRGRVGEELLSQLRLGLWEALAQDGMEADAGAEWRGGGVAGVAEKRCRSSREGVAAIASTDHQVSWHWTRSGRKS